jgi:hypothetical protein
MSTTDDLRELTRQTRLRLGEAERLRVEQRLITAETDRRLRESRELLTRAALRWARPPAPVLRRV